MPEGKIAKTKKKRFNVIDFTILLVFLVCMIGVALRFNIADKISGKNNTDQVNISFRVATIQKNSVNSLKIGDVIYSAQNNMPIGTLQEVEAQPAESFISNADGKMVKTYYLEDTYYDVRGVISASGVITEDGFMLNGSQYIAAGKEIKIQSANIETVLTVMDVKKQ